MPPRQRNDFLPDPHEKKGIRIRSTEASGLALWSSCRLVVEIVFEATPRCVNLQHPTHRGCCLAVLGLHLKTLRATERHTASWTLAPTQPSFVRSLGVHASSGCFKTCDNKNASQSSSSLNMKSTPKTFHFYFPALTHEPVRANNKLNAWRFCRKPCTFRVVLFELSLFFD